MKTKPVAINFYTIPFQQCRLLYLFLNSWTTAKQASIHISHLFAKLNFYIFNLQKVQRKMCWQFVQVYLSYSNRDQPNKHKAPFFQFSHVVLNTTVYTVLHTVVFHARFQSSTAKKLFFNVDYIFQYG